MPNSARLSPTHLALALVVVVIWGINFVVAKLILQHFATLQTLSLRFLMVATLLPLYPKPPMKIKSLIILTLTFSVGHLGAMFGSMYVGLDASLAAILQQLGIPMVLVLSVFFLQEKLGWKSLLGIAVTIAGTAVLVGVPNAASNPLGVALILFSALFWALYSLELKKLGSTANPVATMVWMSALSLPLVLPASLLTEANMWLHIRTASLMDWVHIAFLAFIASIVSHSLWYYLILRNPMQLVAPFMLLTPLTGAAGAILLLEEDMTIRLLTGGLMMIAGVGIVMVRRAAVVEAGED